MGDPMLHVEFLNEVTNWNAFACTCYNIFLIYFIWDIFKFIYGQWTAIARKIKEGGVK